MKIRSIKGKPGVSGHLAMTPMIDIVFQLLVFFILTFKVVPQEGDLTIQAAAQGKRENTIVSVAPLPLQLHLTADENGDLAGIRLNETDVRSLSGLQSRLIAICGTDHNIDGKETKPSLTLVAEPGLKYHHVIEAVTAVSGYREEGSLIRLIEQLSIESPARL